MSFTTPWKPSLHDIDLPSCSLVEGYIVDDVKPSSQDSAQRPWSFSELSPVLNKHPPSKDALWECILAIWRLKLEEEKGSRDMVWRDHMKAWLFRYRDIVREAELEPLKVIVDYMETLERTRYLPLKELVRSLERGAPAPGEPSVPEGVLGNEPFTPKKSQSRARPTKKSATKKVDVEMTDQQDPADDELIVGGRKNKKKTKQGGKGKKKVANSDVEVDRPEVAIEKENPPEASDDQPETAVTGSKRRNFTHVEIPSKRPRGASKPVKIDLGGLTLEEDTAIDLELVPTLAREVCGYCARRNETCEPLWHLKFGKTTIHCKVCMVSRQGCSLAKADLGIVKWPTLIRTKEGNTRRRLLTEGRKPTKKAIGSVSKVRGKDQKQGPGKMNQAASPPNVRDLSEGSLTSNSSVASHREVEKMQEPVSISLVPGPSASSSGPPGSRPDMIGTEERLYLESLNRFESVLRDPLHTPTSLYDAILELRAIMSREAGVVSTLNLVVEGRKKMMRNLCARLEQQANELEGERAAA